jgi:signal transduction histidine kinase
MIPHSIRWRLPLSYMAIALLATVALSTMLIATLRLYFEQNEANYLYQNAHALGNRLVPLMTDQSQGERWKAQVDEFAFLLQTRIRILDPQRAVVVDSGIPDPSYIDLIISSEEAGTTTNEPYLVVKRQPFALPVDPIELPTPFVQPLVPGGNEQGAAPPQPPPAPFPSTNLLLGFVLGPEATRSGQRSDQEMITPIDDPHTGQILGFVQLLEGPAYGSELIERAALVIILASLVATAAAAAVGWFISRRMTRPIVNLTAATTAMAGGDLGIRAEAQRHDEIGVLAQAFNMMAQRIEETVTTLRRFVADAAHELNTPLTALRTHLELALDDASPAEQARFIGQARDDVDRLAQLANDLLDLSRIEAGSGDAAMTTLDVVQMCREVEELYSSAAEQKNVQLRFQVPDENVQLSGNSGQVRRALINVLENALKFTPPGGSVTLNLTADAEHAIVQIQDTGIGIPPDDLPHVFSRFHRARNSAAYPGSGLGLAIVKAIVLRHGGEISVQSDQQGTCCTLRWPRVLALPDAKFLQTAEQPML